MIDRFFSERVFAHRADVSADEIRLASSAFLW
jgi:hypothetical protein